jgi:hypothetical protein
MGKVIEKVRAQQRKAAKYRLDEAMWESLRREMQWRIAPPHTFVRVWEPPEPVRPWWKFW